MFFGKRIQSLMVLGLALLALTVASGCGYSTKRPFRSGIQTVHVEMIESREFRRELEFSLTEALVKRIEMDTPYRIANRPYADTEFSGEILEVRQRVIGKQFGTNDPREIGATVVMRYRWKDLRSGEILVERPRFVHMTSYVPSVGESFEKGIDVRGLDQMAERIVETMESDWE